MASQVELQGGLAILLTEAQQTPRVALFEETLPSLQLFALLRTLVFMHHHLTDYLENEYLV